MLTYSLRIFTRSFRRYLVRFNCNNLSDSEIWIKSALSNEKLTSFEDEEGNQILPTGIITYSKPLKSYKARKSEILSTYFIDHRRVKFIGGKGGDGCISFLHLFNNPLAGPDGGDGGNGGHILLIAKANIKSLANIQSLYFGNNGERGMSKNLTGKSGKHLEIEVPIGTLVKNMDGEIIADLDQNHSMFIAARGGYGGKGNHFFLSNINRHPRVCEIGAYGEKRVLDIELKMFAHAGLIGFPNVGKSTLLRAISRARPKVASYPFTTLNPHIGVVHYDDYTQIAVADLPGLIKGSHAKEGLGFSFLKHVERCVCIIFVIDISTVRPWEQLEALRYELDQYKKGLSKRPNAIVANKYDSNDLNGNLNDLRNYLKSNISEGEIPIPVIPISAKYGNNLLEFLTHLRVLYDLYNKTDFDEEVYMW